MTVLQVFGKNPSRMADVGYESRADGTRTLAREAGYISAMRSRWIPGVMETILQGPHFCCGHAIRQAGPTRIAEENMIIANGI